MAAPLRYREVMDAQASLVARVCKPARNLLNEPKGAPGPGITAATWVQEIRPYARASGLDVGSVVVTTMTRFMSGFKTTPSGRIDPELVDCADYMVEGMFGGYDLARAGCWLDLQGESGQPWIVAAGYVELDNGVYRTMDCSWPYILTDIYPMSKAV